MMDRLWRIDEWLLRRVDRFVAWAWDVHGVSKILLMRAAIFVVGAEMLTRHLREGTLVIGVVLGALVASVQVMLEAMARDRTIFAAVSASNRVSLMGLFFRTTQWPFLLSCVMRPLDGSMLVEQLGFAAWFYLEAAKVPPGPPKSRRRERRSAVVPQGA